MRGEDKEGGEEPWDWAGRGALRLRSKLADFECWSLGLLVSQL